MRRYVLDTTALIDLSKGREPAVSRIRAWIAAGDEVIVMSIQVAEFYRGIHPQDRATWDAFFRTLVYWDISLSAARRAGVIRYELDRQGKPLPLTDTLIAAATLEGGAVLVTNNIKHYAPIQGVQLLPLRP